MLLILNIAKKDNPGNLSLVGDRSETFIKAKATIDAVSDVPNKH